MFHNENILCTKKVPRIRVAAAKTPKQCIAGVSGLWVKARPSVCDSLELKVDSVKMREVRTGHRFAASGDFCAYCI